MSYILNALKKAEHERLREDAQDLDDFVSAGWDPYQPPEKSRQSYAMIALAVLFFAVVIYAIYSAQGPVSSESSVKASALSPAVPSGIAAGSLDQVPPEKAPINQKSPEASSAPDRVSLAETTVPPAVDVASDATALPQVVITGHMYIRPGSTLNRIFVGERTYHVGEKLDSAWIIEAISADSVTIRAGDSTANLPLR
jgi:hypothetical protein